MSVNPYQLYEHLQTKGYVIPMEGQLFVDELPSTVNPSQSYSGTGERLKSVMELDRLNVFKAYFLDGVDTESTWLAGDEPGHGMLLPLWAERLIHADVLVMQEKIETTIDYLLHKGI